MTGAANDNGFKLAYSYKEAALAVGASRNTLSKMVGAGEMKVCRRGRRVYIPRTELERCFGSVARAA